MVVALLEAAGLIVMGIAGVLASLVDDGAMIGTNAGVLIVFALIGGFLLIMVRELWHGKRRGRGPVITWQILQFAVAASSFGAVRSEERRVGTERRAGRSPDAAKRK